MLLGVLFVTCQDRKLDCTCSDVDPRSGRDKHLKYVNYRCLEHRQRGDCEKGFIFNTPEELPEGFCQITCGRCECCKTLRNVAEDAGLEDWIWAMEATELQDILDNPGIEVSVLVPRSGALDEVLTKLGDWSRNEIKTNDKKRAILAEVLKFNMISAIPDHWAVYSSPFFKEGLRLATEFDPEMTVLIREWGGGSIGFQGAFNSATVNSKDVDKATCKGYIQITDQYLLPFEDGSRLMKAPSEPGSLPAMCQVQEQTVFRGEVLETVKADNAGDCCNACNKRSKCNVWSFCARETGCHKGEGVEGIWWGDCQLKQASEVDDGDEPFVQENSILTAFHSGYLTPSSATVATSG